MRFSAARPTVSPLINSCHISRRSASFFSWRKKDPEAEKSVVEQSDEPQDLWGHLSEEEINRIRDCSGLDEEQRAYETRTLTKPLRFTKLEDYKRESVRRNYAIYGKASGLKPGVCWPSKEELEFTEKFEKTFYPPLEKLWADEKARKEAVDALIAKKEADFKQKLSKLDKAKADFMKLHESKLLEGQEELKKKEQLIAEVREFVGFNIDPRDERFQEALLRKEERDRALIKSQSAKRDKQQKLADMLKKVLDVSLDEHVKKRHDDEKK